MKYQSPISPGYSWYEDTAGPRPDYAPLDGDLTTDVVIVGGGFTGLSAATRAVPMTSFSGWIWPVPVSRTPP